MDIILSGMTITPERNLKVAFVGPYLVSGKSILTRMIRADALDMTGVLEELEAQWFQNGDWLVRLP